MIPAKKNRQNLRLYMYHRKTQSGKSPPPLRQAGRFFSFYDCHRRLRSQSSSIFPDPFFYHDSTVPQIPVFNITRIITKIPDSNRQKSYLCGLLCRFIPDRHNHKFGYQLIRL